MAARLLGRLLPLVPSPVRPIEAETVAAALVAALETTARPGVHFLANAALLKLGRR